jgi:hypothetical protein
MSAYGVRPRLMSCAYLPRSSRSHVVMRGLVAVRREMAGADRNRKRLLLLSSVRCRRKQKCWSAATHLVNDGAVTAPSTTARLNDNNNKKSPGELSRGKVVLRL